VSVVELLQNDMKYRMGYQHQQLAKGRWKKLTFPEQMANIGSEVIRAISWQQKNNPEYSKLAFFRSLELLSLTIDCQIKNKSRLKELTRLYEVLGDYFLGKNNINPALYFGNIILWLLIFLPDRENKS